MAGIDSINQIVALMRTQMANKVRHAGKSANAVKGEASKKKDRQKSPEGPDKIEKLVSLRIKSINPDDPKKGKKVFRIFLESVLLSELGEDLINDPIFYQMVNDIQAAMEEDPQIASLIDKAVADLLGKDSTSATDGKANI
ncbi:hypothetical protein ACO0K9_03625 [Undibacterium sp. Ji50W]|uniref:hypothetical protein n=1 Tax=Undibacterium sp. Ji50W TaxID=3413041 RepID=UPI003BF0DEED